MDIEFHYYITYLIAARAGFVPEDAETIAYASQYIDDNDMVYAINQGTPDNYSNYISQSINILKPKKVVLRIYPIFHFIPGDPLIGSVRRKDGKMHHLNTTPDSENGRAIFDSALKSGDLYRIGLVCHSYADSWAHKNFVGSFDHFNIMWGPFKLLGHVAAFARPDQVNLVWDDQRLISSLSRIDNNPKFFEAAGTIFKKLRKNLDPAVSDSALEAEMEQLLNDLNWAVSANGPSKRLRKARIERYRAISKKERYGGVEIEKYDMDKWMDEAVNENIRGFRIRSKRAIVRFIKGYLSEAMPRFEDHYTWKDPANYRQTHWYRFQEAVKAQQRETTKILNETTFWKLELDLENW